MHETSTPDHPQLYHYTRNQRAKETHMTRFRYIQEKAKDQVPDDGIRVAEQGLAQVSNHTLDPTKYQQYVQKRAEVWPVLSAFYGDYMTVHTQSQHQSHLLYQPSDTGWSKRYAQKMHPYTSHEPRDYPLHRKLRLSAYLDQQQADTRLAHNLCRSFGKDAVLVMGNWSATMSSYFEPIRGKGMRHMLQRHGFTVYLLDEYKASKVCPTCCVGSLKAFKDIKNPRPFKRAVMPTITCHGLLKCTNETCLATLATDSAGTSPYPRYWNRNLAAVLNFWRILLGLRHQGAIPQHFQRPHTAATQATTGQPSAKRRC